MNRTCNGRLLLIKGVVYYRCLGDGSVMRREDRRAPETCPACKRKTWTDPENSGPDKAPLRVVVTITKQAQLDGLGWCAYDESSFVRGEGNDDASFTPKFGPIGG